MRSRDKTVEASGMGSETFIKTGITEAEYWRLSRLSRRWTLGDAAAFATAQLRNHKVRTVRVSPSDVSAMEHGIRYSRWKRGALMAALGIRPFREAVLP